MSGLNSIDKVNNAEKDQWQYNSVSDVMAGCGMYRDGRKWNE